MKYHLYNNKTDEVVDAVELASGVGLTGAATYFRLRNKLPRKEFNKLWTVKVHWPQDNWWKEDKIIIDESLKF